jgi:hypothetical protein
MWGSTVGIVTRLWVENRGIVVCFLAMASDFSLLQSIPANLPFNEYQVSFLGVKERV